jgi:hypothetical protein
MLTNEAIEIIAALTESSDFKAALAAILPRVIKSTRSVADKSPPPRLLSLIKSRVNSESTVERITTSHHGTVNSHIASAPSIEPTQVRAQELS